MACFLLTSNKKEPPITTVTEKSLKTQPHKTSTPGSKTISWFGLVATLYFETLRVGDTEYLDSAFEFPNREHSGIQLASGLA